MKFKNSKKKQQTEIKTEIFEQLIIKHDFIVPKINVFKLNIHFDKPHAHKTNKITDLKSVFLFQFPAIENNREAYRTDLIQNSLSHDAQSVIVDSEDGIFESRRPTHTPSKKLSSNELQCLFDILGRNCVVNGNTQNLHNSF